MHMRSSGDDGYRDDDGGIQIGARSTCNRWTMPGRNAGGLCACTSGLD